MILILGLYKKIYLSFKNLNTIDKQNQTAFIYLYNICIFITKFVFKYFFYFNGLTKILNKTYT